MASALGPQRWVFRPQINYFCLCICVILRGSGQGNTGTAAAHPETGTSSLRHWGLASPAIPPSPLLRPLTPSSHSLEGNLLKHMVSVAPRCSWDKVRPSPVASPLLHCRCSVAKSCPTLQPHGLQQARLLCPPLSPRAGSNLMPIVSVMPSNHLILCRPFSSCPQTFPASAPPSIHTCFHQVPRDPPAAHWSLRTCWSLVCGPPAPSAPPVSWLNPCLGVKTQTVQLSSKRKTRKEA